MKGLMRKDLYQLFQHCRYVLLIMVLFCLCGLTGTENLFFVFYPCIYAGVLPVTLLALDENEKWSAYSGTLPVSRGQLVAAKYMVALLLCGATLLLVGLIQAIRGAALWELLILLSVMAAFSLISSALMLPFVFRFGAEKGRLIYILFVVIVTVVFSAFLNVPPFPIAGIPWFWAAPLAAAVVFALSWWISVKIYQKQEL